MVQHHHWSRMHKLFQTMTWLSICMRHQPTRDVKKEF